MRRTIAARPGAEPTAPRLVGIGGRRGAPLPRSWRLETVPPLDVPEEWRPIAGYEERYEISDHGRIKGLYRYDDGVVHGHLIKCALNRNGYLTARLQDGRKRKTVPVHRLVAEAFIGPRPPGMVVRHGLGGRADASLANIGYGTPEQNRADITQHREILRSSGIGGLSDVGVLEIHRTWLNGAMPARVAEEYVAVMGHASKLLEREKRATARRTASTAGAPASPYPPVAEKMLAVTYQAPETRMTA
jgi:NUMOD4 motif/HNH endonuclease